MLKDLIRSKKFVAMLTGIVAMILGNVLGVSEEQLTGIVGTVIAYILGQGIADAGKEAARMQGDRR